MKIVRIIIYSYSAIITLLIFGIVHDAIKFPQKKVDELLAHRDSVWIAELNNSDFFSGLYIGIIDRMMEGRSKKEIIEMLTKDTVCVIGKADLEYTPDVIMDTKFDDIYDMYGIWNFFLFKNDTLVKRKDIWKYTYSDKTISWYMKNRGIKIVDYEKK